MSEPTLAELLIRRRAVEQRQEEMVRLIRDGDQIMELDLTQSKDALARLDRQIEAAQAAASGRVPGIRMVRHRFTRGY